jgi:hypothetical protein
VLLYIYCIDIKSIPFTKCSIGLFADSANLQSESRSWKLKVPSFCGFSAYFVESLDIHYQSKRSLRTQPNRFSFPSVKFEQDLIFLSCITRFLFFLTGVQHGALYQDNRTGVSFSNLTRARFSLILINNQGFLF